MVAAPGYLARGSYLSTSPNSPCAPLLSRLQTVDIMPWQLFGHYCLIHDAFRLASDAGAASRKAVDQLSGVIKMNDKIMFWLNGIAEARGVAGTDLLRILRRRFPNITEYADGLALVKSLRTWRQAHSLDPWIN